MTWGAWRAEQSDCRVGWRRCAATRSGRVKTGSDANVTSGPGCVRGSWLAILNTRLGANIGSREGTKALCPRR
jgi:hypothetical protein